MTVSYIDPFITLTATASEEKTMLTLSDINEVTNSKDGDIYSDLYKDVHGFRPRHSWFASVEEFDADFERLVKQLSVQETEEAEIQARNFTRFVARVESTMQFVQGADRLRAIEIIADADGELEELKFYGYERLEWSYDLKYGSIKQWLEAA
jgi:hypothetical protein